MRELLYKIIGISQQKNLSIFVTGRPADGNQGNLALQLASCINTNINF